MRRQRAELLLVYGERHLVVDLGRGHVAPVILLHTDAGRRHLGKANAEPLAAVETQLVGIGEVADSESIEGLFAVQLIGDPGASSAQQVDGDETVADGLHPPHALAIFGAAVLDPVGVHAFEVSERRGRFVSPRSLNRPGRGQNGTSANGSGAGISHSGSGANSIELTGRST